MSNIGKGDYALGLCSRERSGIICPIIQSLDTVILVD